MWWLLMSNGGVVTGGLGGEWYASSIIFKLKGLPDLFVKLEIYNKFNF